MCGVAGTEFSLAEFLAPAERLRESRRSDATRESDSAEDGQILLLCPQCDEAFAPEFYRYCPKCGGDAGAGVEVPPWRWEPLSDRLLLAIHGLLLLGVLFWLYFWWLFRE